MKILSNLILLIYLIITLPASGQKTITLLSPDGSLHFTLKPSPKSLMYKVEYKGKPVVDYSALNLQFQDEISYTNLKIGKPVFKDTTDQYELIVGKTKHVQSHYKEVTIPLEEKKMPFRKKCRITMTNINVESMRLFFQVDYTLTEVPDDAELFIQTGGDSTESNTSKPSRLQEMLRGLPPVF